MFLSTGYNRVEACVFKSVSETFCRKFLLLVIGRHLVIGVLFLGFVRGGVEDKEMNSGYEMEPQNFIFYSCFLSWSFFTHCMDKPAEIILRFSCLFPSSSSGFWGCILGVGFIKSPALTAKIVDMKSRFNRQRKKDESQGPTWKPWLNRSS